MASDCPDNDCRSVLETLPCPTEFKKFYCLNNSECFVVKIENSMIYNCECPQGFLGLRCEFKDLDQSYLRQRYNAMMQQASLTAAFIVLMVLIVLFILFLYIRKSRRENFVGRNTYRQNDLEDTIDYEGGLQTIEDAVNLPFNNRIV